MNFSSIKVKIILTILVCLTLGAIGILYLIDASYQNNINLIAKESVKTSEEAFKNLEANDTNMLAATLEALIRDDRYRNLFMAKDRDGLYKAAAPLFEELKTKHRITHWYFHNPEPESTAFLRVHKKEQFGDVIKRYTYQQAVKTKELAAGKELGKTAFALRVVHPYYANGKLIGYMELGEEIDHFLGIMRQQIGNEYGLLIKKDYLDAKEWASVRQSHGLRNNWNDFADVVLVNSTVKDNSIISFDGDIESIPNNGLVLGEVKNGNSVFVRGVFPVRDASGKKVGGVFFLQDITAIYNDMKSMQTKITVVIAGLMLAIIAILTYIMNKLVIRRLSKLVDVATVVVGGDYNTQITPSAKDEIGQFESLFEQFRQVFVSLMKELEEKMDRKSA